MPRFIFKDNDRNIIEVWDTSLYPINSPVVCTCNGLMTPCEGSKHGYCERQDWTRGNKLSTEGYMNFETKDSGKRQEFSTGMKRDVSDDKIRYDLVDMPMFKRWAELMTRGAKKYGPNNWKKAETQEELDRFKESAFRHFMTWFLEEDTTEDHAAATYFNIAGVELVKAKLNETK
jgi:hypothetical protein